jgi:lantibiotic modifying enzyme
MHAPFTLRIEEIANALTASREMEPANHGLLGGGLGHQLFWLHYAEATQSRAVFHNAVDEVEKSLEEADLTSRKFTFCDGIAGLCWMVEYLVARGWLADDAVDVLEPVDDHLYHAMMRYVENDNYDFLHGAGGIGFYFANRSSQSERINGYMQDLVRGLKEKACDDGSGDLKWFHLNLVTGEKNKDEFNLGLAHGIPSILILLIRIYEAGVMKKEVYQMIEKTTKYIIKNQFDIRESSSYFPSFAKDRKPNSRLGWCYGDLGVCCALWQAARTLNDTSLGGFVRQVMIHAAGIREPQFTRVMDAGICHGSAGVAHIFRRFYEATGEAQLKEASDYWYDKTLAFAMHSDGYAGYKVYLSPVDDKPAMSRVSSSVLEGISGIGLVLLYKVFHYEPVWEKALLIT